MKGDAQTKRRADDQPDDGAGGEVAQGEIGSEYRRDCADERAEQGGFRRFARGIVS